MTMVQKRVAKLVVKYELAVMGTEWERQPLGRASLTQPAARGRAWWGHLCLEPCFNADLHPCVSVLRV